jgi:UDP-N-acetylglucosamine--N-acetylmuramyl-(pentapeptide) pyrophosphoryl-undecaprenol N-acetylglucosamine transferase
MRVVLAGGGTAGHIEPALSLADALRRHDPAVQIVALGTERGLERRLVPQRGYELALIPPVPLPRRPSWDLLTVPTRLRRAVSVARDVIEGADVVVGFGGYVALPAYLAARRAGVPIVVHEANAKPGLANRIGARHAAAVAVASPVAKLPRAVRVGMPLRTAISGLDRHLVRADGRAFFGLPPVGPVLLVYGGSQGARTLNRAVAEGLETLLAAGVRVLHAVGSGNELPTASSGYVPVPYLDRMDLAYAAADLAMCRAGAMTCAELSAVGLPGIFVPLPIGNGEQRRNAEPLVTAGGGVLVPDDELDGDRLCAESLPLLQDGDRLRTMSAAASRFGVRDADERLAELVRSVVSR